MQYRYGSHVAAALTSIGKGMLH
ncbi:MAG: hypothetical protein JWR77_2534, partial [Rhizorhabdus sp.]|nr:hypothetical protein [Rhizorhabdus sp.]